MTERSVPPPQGTPFVPRRGGAAARAHGGPAGKPSAGDQARSDAGEPVGPPHSESDGGGRARAPSAEIADAFGPLAPYLSVPAITDVLIAPGGALWLDEGSGLRRDEHFALAEDEVRALAVRLISAGGRHIDEAVPLGDVRIGAGIRVHAVLPPISPGGTTISIRLPRAAGLSLDELAAGGMMTSSQRDQLRAAVAGRRNLLLSGATGSGKTTLLSALLGTVPPDERIVIVEDLAELQLRHPHVVSLEARQANLEGAGGIGLATLVREALRMRPDRLVVGECRGAEVRELLAALNTGHDGGAGTLHANSLSDVPARLEALGALAGMAPEVVARQAVSALDLVVHLTRGDGRRVVEAIGALSLDASGRLRAEAL